MKTKLLGFVVGALLTGGVNVLRADLEVSASVRVKAVAEFHAPLAAHGTWVEVRGHGNCWRPAGVAVDWRPYCVGQWVWTDCGWYWESDEPWAWASYHYGWWVMDPAFGWVWVPGIEWAPAWVSWRVGGGYCGWAPLAPRGVVIRETHFVFVEDRRFHEPVRPRTVIVNNTTIIKNTTVVNVKRETRSIAGLRQTVMVNEGPKVEVVQRASGQKFAAKPIQEVARHTEERAPATVRRQAGTQPGGRDAQKPGAEKPGAEKPRDAAERPNADRSRDGERVRDAERPGTEKPKDAERRDPVERRDVEKKDVERRDVERRDAERRAVRERMDEKPEVAPAPAAPRTPETPRVTPEARRPVQDAPQVAPQPGRQPQVPPQSQRVQGHGKLGNAPVRPKESKGAGRHDREDGR